MNGGHPQSAGCRIRKEREKWKKRLCIVTFENDRQSSFILSEEVRLKCAAGFDCNQHAKPCELPCSPVEYGHLSLLGKPNVYIYT